MHVLWLLIELDFGTHAHQIGSRLSNQYLCGLCSASDLGARYVQAVVVAELASVRSGGELTPNSRSRLGQLIDVLDAATEGQVHLPLDFWHRQFDTMGTIYTLLGRPHESLRELADEYIDKLRAYGDTVTADYAIAKLRLMFWEKNAQFKRLDFKHDFLVSLFSFALLIGRDTCLRHASQY